MKNLIFLFITILFFSSCTQQPDNAQWRGDNRDGIYQETNLLKVWPEEGPELLWEYEGVGNGYGSPAITSDKLFINGEIDSLSHLFAFDLTGQLLWKFEYDSSWVVNYPGSRSTPTVVNDLVYVCSPMGEIVCVNANEGTKQWSTNMIKDYKGKNTRFGFSQSLLVDGDKVFFAPGDSITNVVAFNRFTGETIWTSKAKSEKAAYCSPLLIQLPTRNILVTFSEFSLFGLDTKSGELLWAFEDTIIDTKGNTPLYVDGHIYCASYGNGTVKLKLSDDGSEITEVWRNKEINNIQGGLIKIADKLYGSRHQKFKLNVLDANSGEFIDSLEVKRGITIAADDMLYYYAEQGGFMNLINPEPKLTLISEFRIEKGTKEHFAHPVIKNGVLYIRHGNVLLAYNIRKEEV
ncbi:MAG: PQQ-binding-like beta-propeller repeat protein [Bacteroidales bacterium]|nr:PQQ-binding-like beta-propeller repeat protein [Bacteroidales bacterium]